MGLRAAPWVETSRGCLIQAQCNSARVAAGRGNRPPDLTGAPLIFLYGPATMGRHRDNPVNVGAPMAGAEWEIPAALPTEDKYNSSSWWLEGDWRGLCAPDRWCAPLPLACDNTFPSLPFICLPNLSLAASRAEHACYFLKVTLAFRAKKMSGRPTPFQL